MFEEIKPEIEERMINRVARLIVDYGLETPAEFLLPGLSPMLPLGQVGYFLVLAPIIPLLGDTGERYFQLFQKRENIQKMVEKVKELKKLETERKKKIVQIKGVKKRKSLIASLKERLRLR